MNMHSTLVWDDMSRQEHCRMHIEALSYYNLDLSFRPSICLSVRLFHISPAIAICGPIMPWPSYFKMTINLFAWESGGNPIRKALVNTKHPRIRWLPNLITQALFLWFLEILRGVIFSMVWYTLHDTQSIVTTHQGLPPRLHYYYDPTSSSFYKWTDSGHISSITMSIWDPQGGGRYYPTGKTTKTPHSWPDKFLFL